MQDLPMQLLPGRRERTGTGNLSGGIVQHELVSTVLRPARHISMLPRHKKALSDMKSAEKKLKDAQTKYDKTKEALAKARKGVADAKARLAAAQELWES
jgi:hypothetical protein